MRGSALAQHVAVISLWASMFLAQPAGVKENNRAPDPSHTRSPANLQAGYTWVWPYVLGQPLI